MMSVKYLKRKRVLPHPPSPKKQGQMCQDKENVDGYMGFIILFSLLLCMCETEKSGVQA